MLEAASPPSTSSEARSGKSAPVTTAFTPGSASAFLVSMPRMRAWACGLRLMRPQIMPGMTKSAPNAARPVTLSTPSGRIGRVPTLAKCSAASRAIEYVAHATLRSCLSSAAASSTARMTLS